MCKTATPDVLHDNVVHQKTLVESLASVMWTTCKFYRTSCEARRGGAHRGQAWEPPNSCERHSSVDIAERATRLENRSEEFVCQFFGLCLCLHTPRAQDAAPPKAKRPRRPAAPEEQRRGRGAGGAAPAPSAGAARRGEAGGFGGKLRKSTSALEECATGVAARGVRVPRLAHGLAAPHSDTAESHEHLALQ